MQPDGNSVPRRQKVPKRPGIYFRINGAGQKIYEHDWYSSDGRRRWKSGFTTIREAEASREELRGRIRRGERVVPSRVTLGEYSLNWLATQTRLRDRTLEKYEIAVRLHITPLLGRLKVTEVREDDIVLLIGEMQRGNYAAWTIKGVLTPLGRILGHAAREGVIASNPMLRLERGERPTAQPREPRELSPEEIERYLAAAPERYRTLLTTAVFTGLRLGEVQGLHWQELDFEGGRLRVRRQLDRSGRRVEPKTQRAKRDVVLMPSLARALKAHRLASPFSGPTDFVFASERGTPLGYRNIERRAHDVAASDAGLNPAGVRKLLFHDLRATFASLLIAQGADVVYVSRQLGHSSPDITLRFYARLFDQARHAEKMSAALEASFSELVKPPGAPAVRVVSAPA